MLVGHLHIIFEETFLQVPCPFLKIGLFVFLLLSCRYSLYILGISPLSHIWFANIFSHSLGCFFTLLIVPFDAKTLLFLGSSASLLYFIACAFGVISLMRVISPPLTHPCIHIDTHIHAYTHTHTLIGAKHLKRSIEEITKATTTK